MLTISGLDIYEQNACPATGYSYIIALVLDSGVL